VSLFEYITQSNFNLMILFVGEFLLLLIICSICEFFSRRKNDCNRILDKPNKSGLWRFYYSRPCCYTNIEVEVDLENNKVKWLGNKEENLDKFVGKSKAKWLLVKIPKPLVKNAKD